MSNTEAPSNYAIVETSGRQIRVSQGQKLVVNRIDSEVGSSVTLSKVVAVANGDVVTLGAPVVPGASVTVKVLSHLRGPKVVIFKKRRRKGYTKKQGHRQDLTEIQVESIGA